VDKKIKNSYLSKKMSTDKNYCLFFIVFIISLVIILLLQNKKFVLFCKKQVVKEPICIKKIPEILGETSTSQIDLASPPVKEKCMNLHAELPCLGVKPLERMPNMSCGVMNDSAVKLNYDT